MASDDRAASWPLLVAEVVALWRRGFRPSKVRPDALAQVFAKLDTGGVGDVGHLQSVLSQVPTPQSIVKFELIVPTPLWRLAAVAPLIAAQCGGAMACRLRISLPAAYPLVPLLGPRGGSVEVSSPGVLGKHASNILTQVAHAKLVASHSAPDHLLLLITWMQDTELHDCAAAALQPTVSSEIDAGHVRAFVRFHHVLCVMKQSYLRMWAEDLDVAALLAAGQPAMLLVEGPRSAVRAYLDRATKIMHWGPTPARLVASSPLYRCDNKPLSIGLLDVARVFPAVVHFGGTYNGRDCIDYVALADVLGKAGHGGAARELQALARFEFAHVRGRVKEAGKGGGWIGYASPEPQLSQGGQTIEVPRAAPDVARSVAPVPDSTDEMEFDFDPELEEAIRQSLAASGNSVAIGDVSEMDVSNGLAPVFDAEGEGDEEAELAEAIRLSLGAASDVMLASG